jgi:hypothetical protein
MIQSSHKLEFISSTGSTVVLLDLGDYLEQDIDMGMQNQVETYAAIGAAWGKARPKGGARRNVDFGVFRNHASHSAADEFVITHAPSLPFTATGKLRVTLASGSAWDMADAVIVAAVPRRSDEMDFGTLTRYRIEAGKTTAV